MRQDVVAAAQTWIGTPYVHQQSVLAHGCDCLGLVRGVWREVIGREPVEVPRYSRDWSEPQGEEELWRASVAHLISKPRDDTAQGDVLLFRMREGAVAKHLGIQSQLGAHPKFIHAYERRGVVESPLSRPWARRVVARFAFPDNS